MSLGVGVEGSVGVCWGRLCGWGSGGDRGIRGIRENTTFSLWVLLGDKGDRVNANIFRVMMCIV